MFRNLPPLQLLIAFEAAARLGSFKRAALELHLTASAISQQIRSLEDTLGMPLFERRHREVVLNEAGRRYADKVCETLGALARETRHLRERGHERVLRISTDAFMAHEYLVPNLTAFRKRMPEVDLRIETSMSLTDFRRDPIDAALRWTSSQVTEPGVWSKRLQTQKVVLVGAPSLAATMDLPGDLACAPIVCIENRYESFRTALGDYLQTELDPESVILVDTYYAMIRAAERGLGVSFAMRPSIDPWFRQGRLVELLDATLAAEYGLYFVCAAEHADQPEMIALVDWVQDLLAEPCETGDASVDGTAGDAPVNGTAGDARSPAHH